MFHCNASYKNHNADGLGIKNPGPQAMLENQLDVSSSMDARLVHRQMRNLPSSIRVPSFFKFTN
jgi:hypothetical protein